MSAATVATAPVPVWRSTGVTSRSLRLQGYLDGLRGIPSLPADPMVRLRSGQTTALESAARYDFAAEREAFDEKLMALKDRQRRLQRRVAPLKAALQEIEAEEGRVRKRADETERRAGEENLSAAVVQRRRHRETQRILGDYQQRLEAAQEELSAAEIELEGLPEQLQACRQSYRSRLTMINERVRESSAVYWRSVLRLHRDRVRLSPRVDAMPSLLEEWDREQGGHP